MEDYKVIRPIGKGSFGKVYLVRHATEHRQYVMKVIKLKGIPPKEREACRNEVMLMQRLKHPNIVAFKDSFFANGKDNLCIVMTYCDGGDLAGRLSNAKGQLFKEDQIMHWFVQIALAIHHMHANSVLHRDIKTQNIFLLGNGRLVLGDLGISKVLDGTMQFASTQIGTPYYMSPELFKNKPYNHKSDVWAVGCVLYELCTLAHPFDAQSLQGLAQKIMKGSYAPINPKYSQSLRQLIASMLAQNPSQRPSMAEVLQQPYLKKHLYNFIKDIVERSNLGLGAAPKPQDMVPPGANAPISEGTMMFRAAAFKAANNSGGEAATSHAVAAGLGPHAANMQAQLQALGLQSIIAQALQDAAAAASAPPASIKPAFSLADLPKPAAAVPVVQAPVVAAVSAAAAAAAAAPAASAAASEPVPRVLGPDGRPLSPNRARKYLKEQQAALEREEERKKAVELALARLRQEKDMRDRQREELRKKAERRLSRESDVRAGAAAAAPVPTAGVAPLAAPGIGMPGGGGGGGAVKAGAGAALFAAVVPVGPSGKPRISAAVAAVPAPAPAPAVGIRGVGVRAGGGAAAAPAAAPAPSAGPSSAGAAAMPSRAVPSSSSSAAAAAAAPADKGSDLLRDRAAALRREAAAAEAARKAKVDAAVAKYLPANAGAVSSSGGAGSGSAAPSAPSSRASSAGSHGPVPGDAERKRVADLDSWEREKVKKPVVGVNALYAAAAAAQAASGGSGAGAGGSNSARGSAVPSRESSAERVPPSAAVAPSSGAVRDVSRGKERPAAAPTASASSSSRPSPAAAAPAPAPAPAPAVASLAGGVARDRDRWARADAGDAVSVGSSVSSGSNAVPSARISVVSSVSAVSSSASSAQAAASAAAAAANVGLPPKPLPFMKRESSSGSSSVGSGGGATPVATASASGLSAAAPAPGALGHVRSSSSGSAGSASSAGLVVAPAPSAPGSLLSGRRTPSSGPSPSASASVSVASAPAPAAALAAAPAPAPAPAVLRPAVSVPSLLSAPISVSAPTPEHQDGGDSSSSGREGLSARDRVLLMKEARRRAEEEATRARLAAAAMDSVAERKKAQYMVREQYRGVNAAIAGALPINSRVLEESVADAEALVTTLRAQLPGARYGDAASSKLDDDGEEAEGKDEAEADGEGAAAEEEGGAAARAGGGGAGGRGSRREYAPGELPEDDDSEDEVLLEMAQDSGSEDEATAPASAAAGPGRAGAGAGAGGAGGGGGELRHTTSHHITIDEGTEDEQDIGEVEKHLREELMRSTMRCNDLRQSLDVARKIAVSAGVPLAVPGSARRNRMSGAALTPTSDARVPGGGFHPDDRPIKPAPGAQYGGAELPLPLPPGPRGVLAPSAAATAAAGGYISASASASAAARGGAAALSAEDAVLSGSRRLDDRRVSAGAVVGRAGDDDDEDEEEEGEGADAEGRDGGDEDADAAEDGEDEEDEEDLGDEDGDEEGGIAFQPKPPRSGNRGGAGAGGGRKMGPGTIRELDNEDEDEEDYDDEDEEDEEDSMYGSGNGIASEFKTRLGLQGDGDGDGSSGGAGGGGGVGSAYGRSQHAPSSGVGILSSRVEELRRQCISALGEDTFDAAYTAVKRALWGEAEGEGDEEEGGDHKDTDAGEEDLDTLPQRLGLNEEEAGYIDTIVSLVHMEHDLL